MLDQTYIELQSLTQTQGAAAALERLIAALREERRHHQLFDALLLKRKFELGLPLAKPTSFADVPAELQDEFEKHYVACARAVGELLLKDQAISQAWMYFRTIREPQAIAAAIEALPANSPVDEDILDIAFFQGVCPVKGIELLLASHGTCSTITALDQHFMQLTPEIRRRCAALMVRELYNTLRETVQQEVLKRHPLTPPGQSLRDLIAGRDWLFAEGNYHIDVSHLNAVVRFARALDAECPELNLGLQLAQYGSRLAAQYQYAGTVPFEDFYPAHIEFFKVLSGDNREQALAYFRDKLQGDPGEPEQQYTALIVVELLQRLGRAGEAADLACAWLADAPDEFGLSLADLCAQTGRLEQWARVAREKDDVIGFMAAILSNCQSTGQPPERSA